MSENQGTLERLACHLSLAVKPLREAVSDTDNFMQLMYRLGWEVESLPPEYEKLGAAVGAALQALETLDEERSPEDVLNLLSKAKDVYQEIGNISVAPPGVDAGTFLAEIGERLFELLWTDYLAAELPMVFNALQALDVIQIENLSTDGAHHAFIRTRFKWDEIPKIVGDPLSIVRRVYGWGEPQLEFDLILEHLTEIFVALGLPVVIPPTDESLVRQYSGIFDEPLTGSQDMLKLPFYYTRLLGQALEAAFVLLELPASGGKLPGIVIEPHIPSELPVSFKLSDTVNFTIRGGSDIASHFGILIRPDEVSVKYPFQPGRELPRAGFGLKFDYHPTASAILLGSPRSTRLEVAGAEAGVQVNFVSGQLEFILNAEARQPTLVLTAGDSDSFLRDLLGDGEKRVEIGLGLEWSSKRGLNLNGGSGFEVELPSNIQLGPILVQAVQIRLYAPRESGPRIRAQFGASLTGRLGPLTVTVRGIGIQFDVLFEDGNAGPADVAVGFRAPDGAGLAINAPMVAGGGFLSFDSEQGQYSGFLELKIAERISVKAFGLLSTRLPGGGKGYSLIILIFVEGFKPIPLGFGFNLAGIGGLLALNRTFDEEALRTGLKQHTLDSVMFPQDPVRNAPQIISNLNRVFPPAIGHHLFGPMVQITWGTPALITAEVAVVLEFGARRRLLLLAQVLSILPRPDHELVRLQMDAVGVVDFDQGTAALDATLFDSRLLQKFPMTGDMAMRLKWESSPNFALAVGGLHPAFNPPPNFPKLERIAINLSSGDNPRLRCEAYYALTSNTVQFGARAELYASAAGFSVHGDIGYDVLIQFDPFFFQAAFHAQLQLKRGSTNLFKVRLEGSLSGPRPLHLKGKATFEIFWWDFTIRIDKTLVSGEKPPLPAPVEVLPRLKDALAQAGNWTARLPDGSRSLVQLRANAGAATDILLHPLGTLTVKQGVVPLNMDISRFGQAAPAGPRRFTITGTNLGGQDQPTAPVRDFFAPAQFIELTDDQKLSRPSFEVMDAGISFGSDALSFTSETKDWLEVKTIEFETWILDNETGEARRSEAEKPQPQQPPLFYQLNRTLLLQQARFGAAGSSELRRSGKAKYRATTIGKYQANKEGWSVVSADDLTQQPLRKPASYSEAVESLRQLQQREPAKAAELTILRLSEVKKE
jgi:hypothetical protein